MPVTVGMIDHKSGSACSHLSHISQLNQPDRAKQKPFLTDVIKIISSPSQIMSSDIKDPSKSLPNTLTSKLYINLTLFFIYIYILYPPRT